MKKQSRKSTPKRYKMVTFIRCPNCGDEICSLWRHDFTYCRCKETFIDGGFDYCRIGGKDLDSVKPFTRRLAIKEINKMIEAKDREWARRHGR